jgi:hypothetical protein
MPKWVAETFHPTIEGWTAIALDSEVVKAKPGDWAVMLDNVAVVVTDEEFRKCFTPL